MTAPSGVAHAPLGDHRARDVGGALQIVLRAGRDLADRDLLGGAAAEQHRQLVLQVAPLHQVAILERELHRVAERAEPALHDRDLVDRVRCPGATVATIAWPDSWYATISRSFVAHHALLLEARRSAGRSPRRSPRIVTDGVVLARGQQRRLVHQVREVGAGKAGGPRRHDLEVDVGAPSFTLRVWIRRTSSRPFTSGLSTSTCRSKRPGRSRAGSSTSGRLVAAMMMMALRASKPSISASSWLSVCSRSSCAAHRALDARLAERVELVDEDDAGRLGLGLREQVAHARGADADEHLDELGAAQAEEGHLGLAGHGAREQRLARARAGRPAARPSGSGRRGSVYFFGFLQELDDLLQLLLGLVHAGDVREADLHVVFGVDLRLAARERHDAALGAAHPAEEEAPDAEQQQQRHDPAEDLGQPAADDLARVLDLVGLELLDELRILDARRRERRRPCRRPSSACRGSACSPTVTSATCPPRTSVLNSLYGIVRPAGREEPGLREREHDMKPRTHQMADPGRCGAPRCAVRRDGGRAVHAGRNFEVGQ